MQWRNLIEVLQHEKLGKRGITARGKHDISSLNAGIGVYSQGILYDSRVLLRFLCLEDLASFKDFKKVLETGKVLCENGIKPWLAETHIQKEEHT